MAMAIGNAPRACGGMKSGCYLEGGEPSPDGMLLPLVWIVGDMTLDSEKNLLWDVRPQTMYYIDGEYSLDTLGLCEWRVGNLLRARGDYTGSGKMQLQLLHHSSGNPLCLLKHTGESYYTPVRKAMELARRGPSERVTPEVAASMAPLLRIAPLKLFYSSSQVPFFRSFGFREQFLDYLYVEQAQPDPTDDELEIAQLWNMTSTDHDWRWEPTWESEDWRWMMQKFGVVRRTSVEGGPVRDTPKTQLVRPYNGSDHWWLRALSYLHRHPDAAFDGVEYHESVFCGTHFTTALRVVSYEDAQKKTGKTEINPDALDDSMFMDLKGLERGLDIGIKVAILPPEGEIEWR
jgi:hypothetical protein